jgi:FkbM family methyltransferase
MAAPNSEFLVKLKLFVERRIGRVNLGLLKFIAGGHTRPLGLVVRATNGDFLIDVEDQIVGRKLAKGSYGADEIARIQTLVDPSSRVLIVGGHIGSLAIPLSTSVSAVDVIEANPKTFEILRINCRLNGRSNIALHCLAANDTSESLQFLTSRANSGGSKRLPVISNYMYTYDQPETVEVPGARLDSVFADAAPFDVIVMDIEGSEFFALRGMPNLLRDAQHLIVEFVPHHLRNVAAVSVSQFLDAVAAGGFTSMHVPSTGRDASWAQARSVLEEMYRSDTIDDGIIFSKVSLSTSNS